MHQAAAWIRQEQDAADAIAARETLPVLPYVPPWRYDWEAHRFALDDSRVRRLLRRIGEKTPLTHVSRSHDLALAKFGGERPCPLLHDHQDGSLRDALPDEELAVLELTHPAFGRSQQPSSSAPITGSDAWWRRSSAENSIRVY